MTEKTQLQKAEICISEQSKLIREKDEKIKFLDDSLDTRILKLKEVMLLNYDLEKSTRKQADEIEELKTRIDELKDEASDRSTSFMETDDND